jgi:hypothetical protein
MNALQRTPEWFDGLNMIIVQFLAQHTAISKVVLVFENGPPIMGMVSLGANM